MIEQPSTANNQERKNAKFNYVRREGQGIQYGFKLFQNN
jgi:hypothetical protein